MTESYVNFFGHYMLVGWSVCSAHHFVRTRNVGFYRTQYFYTECTRIIAIKFELVCYYYYPFHSKTLCARARPVNPFENHDISNLLSQPV